MKKFTALLLSVMLLCLFSCGLAESRIPTAYNKTISVYDLETGAFFNQQFNAITSYMKYTPNATTMYIDGLYYNVYTSATYIDNGCTFGPIGFFAAIAIEGLTAQYYPNDYKLKVTATPYNVQFDYYNNASRDASGNYTFGGSARGTGTSSGIKFHYKAPLNK
jgi:hypothetical protein